jgi:hypothetical protein
MVMARELREIWLLDDERQRHQAFAEHHAGYYRLTSFYTPEELFAALDSGRRPDLLLIDVYYLKPGVKAKDNVQTEWSKLMDGLAKYRAKYEGSYYSLGIEVAKKLSSRYQFPFLMYSAKAPLFLHDEELSKYALLGEGFIFKGREDAAGERARIDSAMEKFNSCKDASGLRASRRLYFMLMLIFMGFFCLTVGYLIGRFLHFRFWF